MHFRKNETDFWSWCRHYLRRAKSIISAYESIESTSYRIKNIKQYKEAKEIMEQYEVLKYSLTEEQNLLLEQSLINNESFKYNIKTFNNIDEIMRNWSRICFPNHKPKIKSIDKKEIGKSIKEQRLYYGMSLKLVADLLHISEATLKSYEMGTRLVRLDVMYQLSQIYNMTIDELMNITL
ncbi:helix-turn-helix transcriptional regulator [Hujiaoplasma nucleasis]|uniref:Helix-turn-helix transcriptional regulator n=1 Tax=Hujiaoplasma nucleasis TaxID=2725268 RepID=A0A7L6MZJ5_9MOLU|nr:helix-turn-helix transcriptional regulator [Hujiaoplasma nucleasis]QLY39413.1 helix-turn-helix transcriptional regulator [Hujiaoplasma nucleasis]